MDQSHLWLVLLIFAALWIVADAGNDDETPKKGDKP